nr:HK97 gp10 family phage protein [Anaerosolibacter carboniphilus]
MDQFSKDILKLAKQKMPKEVKKFLVKEGAKLNRKVKKKAQSKVKKKTGNYVKGFKKGRVYKYNSDEMAIRVYNGAPHAHLIEHGHAVVRDGKEIGFAKGKKVLEESAKEFENEFYQDMDKLVDEMLDKGL